MISSIPIKYIWRHRVTNLSPSIQCIIIDKLIIIMIIMLMLIIDIIGIIS